MQEWVAWYRQGGVEKVLSHRHGGQGGQNSWLSSEQEDALKERASQGELRTIWDGVDV
jgi:hypothetical protein